MPELPAALDVERSVLGACLTSEKVYLEYAAVLRPEQFHSTFHRKAFEAMAELSDHGESVDLLTVSHALKSATVAELSDLTTGAVVYFQASHVGILHDRYRRRELIRAADVAQSQAYDMTESTHDAYSRIESRLLEVSASQGGGLRPMQAVMHDAMEELVTMRKHDGALLGLTTTIQELDEATTGIRAGELWVVGGRPGHGKTALACQIGFANAKADVPVDVFSLEMKDRQVFYRALAAESGVDATRIRDPRFANVSEWRSVQDAAIRLAVLPMHIDDSDSLHISELIARATLGVRRRKTKLVIVDYLQIVDGPGEDEKSKVGGIVNRLRAFAKREQVAVIALSQLLKSRDPNERPTIGSLRETGRIEDAAHVGLLMFQPVDERFRRTGVDEIIIGKNREGITGSIAVTMHTPSLTFRPRETHV